MRTLLAMLILTAPSFAEPLEALSLPPGAVAALPTPPPEVQPEPAPLTYAQAHAKALASGKPLMGWVGGDFCPACVQSSATEFVHFFTPSYEGVTAPAIVVGVVDDGQLIRAGEVTWWIVGDREFGH